MYVCMDWNVYVALFKNLRGTQGLYVGGYNSDGKRNVGHVWYGTPKWAIIVQLSNYAQIYSLLS